MPCIRGFSCATKVCAQSRLCTKHCRKLQRHVPASNVCVSALPLRQRVPPRAGCQQNAVVQDRVCATTAAFTKGGATGPKCLRMAAKLAKSACGAVGTITV